ncbi:Uncharacterised protein [BD1-7 clade bacterium]|uniref:Sodium:phosphate symporter n=1 Tax=BD1-7 clade bacterium TaxID=2029982 RepID=A0A5S9MRA7_9GAMM|nr:Uncharacterised protein [BD1-7 clade bacterium]
MTTTVNKARQVLSKGAVLEWLAVVTSIYIILLAVGMIGAGFKTATGGQAAQLFEFASNPFLGLVIGTVCTALIQSSSTVTSIIVGLVAGGLPVATAIPMIMGANIGTTITNTIISLGHIRSNKEFERAFSAATVHDFFNLLAVLIFLPLEIMFGILDKLSGWLTSAISGGSSMSIKGFNFIKPITKPVITELSDLLLALGASTQVSGILMIFIGIAMTFTAITLMGKFLKHLLTGKAKEILHSAIGRGPVKGISSGCVVTVLVQSSSTTTSLMVPLVGNGIFRMRDIYPFTLGANIGTCVTALLAATAVDGDRGVFALQIALVHLLYNTLAVLVIYGIPTLREIPPRMAEKLANIAAGNKSFALAYVLGTFFVMPGILIFASK